MFNQNQKTNFMFPIKQLISGTLIVAVSVLGVPKNAIAQSVTKGVKNIVLVRGAFADGGSWSKVQSKVDQSKYYCIEFKSCSNDLST